VVPSSPDEHSLELVGDHPTAAFRRSTSSIRDATRPAMSRVQAQYTSAVVDRSECPSALDTTASSTPPSVRPAADSGPLWTGGPFRATPRPRAAAPVRQTVATPRRRDASGLARRRSRLGCGSRSVAGVPRPRGRAPRAATTRSVGVPTSKPAFSSPPAIPFVAPSGRSSPTGRRDLHR
jgi:hypothetical protein